MFRIQLKFLVIIIILIVQINCEEYEYYDDEQYYEEIELIEFCRDIEINTFIPSPRGNKYYIFCGETANKSYEAKCPDDMPIFKDGICDEQITSPKPIITTIITTIKPPDSTTKLITTPEKTTKIPITTPTTTSTKKITTSTKKPITTITTKLITTTKMITTNRPDFCPSNDNTNYVIFLPSKKNCYEYYICYHGHPLPMYCANKLHFNPITYKCDFPDKVQCKINESVKPLPKCKTVTEIEFYEHPNNCNYFLCCIFGSMSVQQCPYLHNWDFITKSCIPKHLSTCEKTKIIY